MSETCDLCGGDAVKVAMPVENDETGEVGHANLCQDHLDKLERYNDGEEVGFE